MTPQEMIYVIQAHVDGKQLQWTNRGGNSWLDCDRPTPQFAFNACDYRIKPPALRPHWPAIVRSPFNYFTTTATLFADEAGCRENVIGFVRLATEYPPVMLP